MVKDLQRSIGRVVMTNIKDIDTLASYNIDVNSIKWLYKRTSTGAIQIWGQELLDDRYRSVIGQLEGKLQVSDWTVAKPKNIGKKNQRLGPEQAEYEVDNNYTKKLKEGYFESTNNIDSSTLIKPMLAYDWKDYKDKLDKLVSNEDEIVYLSSKLDGGRCLAIKKGLFTRTGDEIKSCDHINEALKDFFVMYPDVVLDGELYNHNDLTFSDIMSIFRREYNTDEVLNVKYNRRQSKDVEDKLDSKLLSYNVFDYISNKRFEDRYTDLINWFIDMNLISPNLFLVGQTTCPISNILLLDNMYKGFIQDNYEGMIIKFNQPYINKRTKYLLKRKDWIDSEYILLDILEGRGNWSGKARIAVFDGFEADIVGTYEECAYWLTNKHMYIGKPTTVKYFELTDDGVPRFGKVKQLAREDI